MISNLSTLILAPDCGLGLFVLKKILNYKSILIKKIKDEIDFFSYLEKKTFSVIYPVDFEYLPAAQRRGIYYKLINLCIKREHILLTDSPSRFNKLKISFNKIFEIFLIGPKELKIVKTIEGVSIKTLYDIL
jgi:hypothetical protein